MQNVVENGLIKELVGGDASNDKYTMVFVIPPI